MAEIEKSDEGVVRRFDPFADLDWLRLPSWRSPWRWPAPLTEVLGGDFVPLADVEETDDAWIVEVELAGVGRDDIDIEVTGNTIRISGERREKEREGVLRHKERVTGSFRYELSLPSDFDADGVEASFDDGELKVVLPKSTADERRQIDIT